MIPARDLPPPEDPLPVHRALLSVYDKAGLVPFAMRLAKLGVELVSTGGTARALREAGLEVIDVADVTGHGAMLDGRVKTLHPAVHAPLLARRTDPADTEALKAAGYTPIDLVVCNLYPFREAVAGGAAMAEAMENVDIGGPTMVRAAAKNHAFVGVVTAPSLYAGIIEELEAHDGALTLATRTRLARTAFAHTAAYDAAVTDYLAGHAPETAAPDTAAPDTAAPETAAPDPAAGDASAGDGALPPMLEVALPQAQALRYGENPHQAGALYGRPERFFEQLHGKDLSFNNLMDLSAAVALIGEFADAPPTVAILKHTNPCGVATDEGELATAYAHAFATDRQSPFGGIVVVNRPLDRATAEAIDAVFTELILAPDFEAGVMGFLEQKKNRRVIQMLAPARADDRLELRHALGGLLAQTPDAPLPAFARFRAGWDVPTARVPTDDEAADLDFAWRVVKHVKSNAIVYAKARATLGIGAGQMSRIDASELAVRKGAKSGLDFTGCVVASDAFFPFADGLEAAAEAGATAAIQPGGSIRDDEVVAAADAHDVAMAFTGRRHFRH